MELNKESEAAVIEEINKRFGDKVYKRFDREKDAGVYTDWNDFFQELEQCKPSLQKKYVFYWAKEAFRHFQIPNFPLFPLLCVTGGSAEIPEHRHCFFEYIADYLLSETEDVSVSKLAMQYVSENCPDNTGRFGKIINEFRNIMRHKYERQQRKKRMMSKLLMIAFGVFCGLIVGFVTGIMIGVHITGTPTESSAVLAESVQGSITESLVEPTESTSLVSTKSDVSEVSSDNGKVSAESSKKKETSSESSVTETTSHVSERSEVSKVSSDNGKVSAESSKKEETSSESSVTETTSHVSERSALPDIFSFEGKVSVGSRTEKAD